MFDQPLPTFMSHSFANTARISLLRLPDANATRIHFYQVINFNSHVLTGSKGTLHSSLMTSGRLHFDTTSLLSPVCYWQSSESNPTSVCSESCFLGHTIESVWLIAALYYFTVVTVKPILPYKRFKYMLTSGAVRLIELICL